MRTIASMGLTVAALLAGAAAGYRSGSGAWPDLHVLGQSAANALTGLKSHERTGRKVLYWKDPDGKPEYSATPVKTAEGRPYLAVYDDQEPDFPDNKPAATAPAAKDGARKILYYRNPMGLPDTSPVPKKDWMGMDYIAVYEGEETDASTVKVSLDRVQRSGVRTAPVEKRSMARPLRAPGIAKPDERTLRAVTLRADSFIEALYANETGKHVKAGEPLFRVYSPQMVSAQVDYRVAVTSGGRGPRDESGALQRLKNLDVPEAVLNELRINPNPVKAFDWPAPVGGVVMQKKVVAGQMVKAGEEIVRLGDLGNIWIIAEVSEQDVGLVKIGAPAKVNFRALPDRQFEGHVSFVLHELDAATRTAKVRIEVKNPEHRIKHEMYADVEIDTGAGDEPRLVVPMSAVIDSGTRQIVIVDRGEGRFQPRQVRLGLKGDGIVEIRDGLESGESVVVAANFLIDAESNLKAALQGFTAEPKPSGEAKP
ncbi:MAG: efflux RND transporter periplasmic adaptor subunit [Hyphomicrobiaceae bacterium]